MTGDCHVRFLESGGVKSPCATYPKFELSGSAKICDIIFSSFQGWGVASAMIPYISPSQNP